MTNEDRSRIIDKDIEHLLDVQNLVRDYDSRLLLINISCMVTNYVFRKKIPLDNPIHMKFKDFCIKHQELVCGWRRLYGTYSGIDFVEVEEKNGGPVYENEKGEVSHG